MSGHHGYAATAAASISRNVGDRPCAGLPSAPVHSNGIMHLTNRTGKPILALENEAFHDEPDRRFQAD
jgi:hypothetical protein